MEQPSEEPDVGPSVEAIGDAFYVYEIRTDDDGRIYYYGEPLVASDDLIQEVWPTFKQTGYEVFHTESAGEDVLIARPVADDNGGIPWTNVILFVLTVISTLFAGSIWFHIDVFSNPLQMWQAWPFTVAIMTVLGVHELGHYALSRYHGVDASLPYFIPVPTLIGTMGAVIRMKGHMPNRKALFDIGVAGPLAGLVATVVITVIGLSLDPIIPPDDIVASEDAVQIQLGFPYLLELIAFLTGQPLTFEQGNIHPVVIGAWVGMLVTFLNMLPAGQLDGGHILRAMAGDAQKRIASLVPVALFGLAGYLYVIDDYALRHVFIWVFWGLLVLAVTRLGPAQPIDDETELGTPRVLIGLLTFVLGLLCFTAVPIQVIE